MNHLLILLIICFIVQSIGFFSLNKNLGNEKQKKTIRIALNTILFGIFIQFVIIIFQLYLYYFINHVIPS